MQILRSLACFALLSSAAFAHADDCVPVVESAWIRQPPMAMPMMAGFAEVRNPCAAPVTVVAASSAAFGSVELHETRQVDGVSRMRHVESLEVPANGKVSLAPGGLHLMLMQPEARIDQGDIVQVDLELSDGRRLRAGFEVRGPDAR